MRFGQPSFCIADTGPPRGVDVESTSRKSTGSTASTTKATVAKGSPVVGASSGAKHPQVKNLPKAVPLPKDVHETETCSGSESLKQAPTAAVSESVNPAAPLTTSEASPKVGVKKGN